MANLKKRALSLFMAVMMVLTAMPMNAIALDSGSADEDTTAQANAAYVHTEDCYHKHTEPGNILGVAYGCEYASCTEHTHSTEIGCAVNKNKCDAHEHGDGCCNIDEHEHKVKCCTRELHAHSWTIGCYKKTCTKKLSLTHIHGKGCYNNELVCGKDYHDHLSDCAYSHGEHTHDHTANPAICNYTCGISTEHTHDADCYSCTITEHTHDETCARLCGKTDKDIDCKNVLHLVGDVLPSTFYDLTGVVIETPEEIAAVLAALTNCKTGCALKHDTMLVKPYLTLELVLCDEHFCSICRRLNDGYCTCVEITFANIGNDPENNKTVKVAKGEKLDAGAVPSATMVSYHFLGWFDAEGNEFSTEVVYKEDITFTAQYKAVTEAEKLANLGKFIQDNFNLGAELGRVITILSNGEINKNTIIDKKGEIVSTIEVYLAANKVANLLGTTLESGVQLTNEQIDEVAALMYQGDEYITMIAEWLWPEGEDQTIDFDAIMAQIDFEKLAEEIKAQITAEYGIEFTQEWVDKNIELLNQYIASVLEEALADALAEVKDVTEQQMEIVLTQIKNEIEHANFVMSLVRAEIIGTIRQEIIDIKAFVREMLANTEMGLYLGKTVSALSDLNKDSALANGRELKDALISAIGMSSMPVAYQNALIAYINENDGIVNQFIDWLWPQITIYWVNGDDVLATDVVALDAKHTYKGETPVKEGNVEVHYVFAGWEVTSSSKDEIVYNATFEAVLNSYNVTWENYDGTVLKTDSVEYGTIPVYTGETPVKEANAQYSYNFTGWEQEIVAVTGDVTYTAKFSETVNEYTVTFVVDGKEIVHTYAYGAMPKIDTPAKVADAQYTYKFAGWDKEITVVTGNATYTAEFTNILNYYTIKFVGENGVVLQETKVAYGATPEYTGETPVKEGNAQYSYTFANWGEIVSVTGDATYTAQFTETVNKYLIKFVDEDGTLLYEQTIEYGTKPVFAKAEPTKAADAQYTYKFAGWNPAVIPVVGDATYTATYSAKVNEYTIKFVDEDGTELQTLTVAYGTTPEYTGEAPVKAATEQYTYKFAGWNPAVIAVVGDATYTAQFDATVNQYTVTFLNHKGEEIGTSTVDYGTAAVAPAEPTREGFVFTGWDKDITEVTGDLEVTAQYVYAYMNSYDLKVNVGNGIPTSDNKWGNGLSHWTKIYNVRHCASFFNDGVYKTDTVISKENAESVFKTKADFDKTMANAVPGNVTYDKVEFTNGYRSSDDYYVLTGNYDLVACKGQYHLDYKADFYHVVTFVVNGVEYKVDVKHGEAAVVPEEIAKPTKDADAQYTYTFAEWDADFSKVTKSMTVNAKFDETVNEYTVTWVVNGEVVEIDENVEYGTMPEFNGATPAKKATAQYTYTFAGWDTAIAVVTGDVTYTATFTDETNVYTVTFVVDGVETTEVYAYGEMPEFADPTKEGNAQYTYTFAGWDKEFVAVTGNVTYTAQFSETVNKYTVTWKDVDGTILETDKNVPFGTMPTFDGAEPTRAATVDTVYTFAGWGKIVEVTGDVTYHASYEGDVRYYTVTFMAGDKVIKTVEVPYNGSVADADQPAATSRDLYKEGYYFVKWDVEPEYVTEDMTVNAVWEILTYTITFKNEDGKVLDTQTVAYGKTPVYGGETPVKAATAQYTYTFAGWDTAIASVTGEATYTATYSATVNEYTIKFVDEDGTVLQSSEVEYGAKPEYTGKTPVKAATAQYTYKFAGFGEIAVVTGEATYTATYSSTVNKYTIKFVEEDGTELQSSEVAYGETPVYSGETPVKAADAQYTYKFAGWNTAIASVTGDATYTATYSSTVNEYTIKFVDEDGTELQSSKVAYGELPVYTGATPFKADTAEFYYDFAGFGEVTTVTGDATYTAVYTATVRTYRVTFKDGDKTLSSVIYAYGAEIVAPVLPTKNGWDSKWNCEFSVVNGDLTVEVVWNYKVFDKHDLLIYIGTGVSGTDSTKNWTKAGTGKIFDARHYDSYDVDGKYVGSTIMTEGVDYKNYTATLGDVTINNITYGNENGADFYVINEFVVVATDAQYHLDCHATLYHTVTFVDYNGNVIDTVAVERGTAATAPADPTRKGYVFTGWDVEFDNVTESMTVTAQYEYEIVTSAKLKVNVGTGVSASGSTKGNGLSHWGKIYNVRSVYSYYDYPNYVGDTIMSEGDFDFERTYNEAVANLKSVKINGVTYTQGEGSSDNYYVLNGEYYFVACKGEFHLDFKADFYNVTTFVVGEEVIKVTTARGAQMEMPADPVVEGYDFDGWETDENGVYHAKLTKVHKVTFYLAVGGSKVFYVRDGEQLDPNWIDAEEDFFSYEVINYWYNGKGGAKLDFANYVVTGNVSFSCKTKDKYGDWDVALKGTLNGETIEMGTAKINGVKHAGCWRNDSANRYNITAYDASKFTMPTALDNIVVDGVTYTYGAGSSDNYYTIDFTTLSCYSIRNSRGKVVDWEYHYTGEIELFHDNVVVNVKIVDGGTRKVTLSDVAHGTVIDTAFVVAKINNKYLVVKEDLVINESGEYTVLAIYTGP